MFASRTRWNLAPNRLSAAVSRLRAQGKTILDLTESNPTACGIAYPGELLQALADPKNLRYEPASSGLASAREAVAADYARHGCAVDPDSIVLTASTSEAYSFVLRLLAEPGDRVIFPRPSYPLLDHLAQLNDVAVDRYFLCYDGAWRLDLDSLRDAVTPASRAVVLVHPNNPTGSFLKRDEGSALQTLCAEKGVALISDEVFADYPTAADASRIPSMAGTSDALTFSLGGLSKMLGLPQMKLSWIAVSGPETAKREALEKLEMIADTYLSVNTPVQNALPRWLAGRESMQSLLRERVEKNRQSLAARDWKKIGCEVLASEGGWNTILRVPSVYTEEEWVLQLLETRGVLVHPGYFFDFESEAYLVLSLLPEPKIFAEGTTGIWEAVSKA